MNARQAILPPLTLLTLGLAAAMPTLAQDWDCVRDTGGDWVCGMLAPEPAPPATEVPVADTPVTPATRSAPTATGIREESALPATQAAPVPLAPDLTPGAAAGRPALPPQWSLCPPLPEREVTFSAPDSSGQSETLLSADQAESLPEDVYVLQGNAVILRPGQRVASDYMRFDDRNGIADAEGRVRYDDPEVHLEAERAHLLVDTDEGEISPADYLLYPSHGRGEAQTVYLEGPQRKRLVSATYTTCAEGSDVWRLRTGQLTLKQDEGVGVARHARLEIHNVPVLYTPYISFPIDDRRKSGFLIPGYGSSDEGGLEIQLPYYWNIAPHRDATITPRYLDKRGLMLGTEVRYLNPDNEGQLDISFLPSDDAFGADRHLTGYRHQGTIGERVLVTADLNDVSDGDYFEDFGNNLDLTSITHLERRIDTTYRGDGWSLIGRAQHFQTVDTAIAPINRPYARLPQLHYSARPLMRPLGLESTLDADITAFDHSRDELVDTGNRIDLRPRISLPLRRTAYEITPALTLAYTQYDLDRPDPTLNDRPSRTTPIFSLDNKIFFERDTHLFGNGYLQTLEPRAFYLYAPEKDHSDLPLFDSAERTFRFQELFSENRFTGADRVADANQLALALTSRYIDFDTGTERLRASIGQLFYFEDREVTLQNTPALEQSTSELAGELEVYLSPYWSLAADGLWDPDDGTTRKGNAEMRYHGDQRRLANLAYRYTKNDLAQLDASWLWPLSARWHLAGRWYYSLQENVTLEGLLGAEYESCCWALRVAWRTIRNDVASGENNNALYLEWELKGLTSLGDKVESLLKNGILGYQP